jgi:hypothetical protein
MTRAISSENYAALQANRLIKRDFVWFTVKTRDTGESVTDGYWSDVGSIIADVVDPESGGTATRTYAGAAGLISISDIPLVSTLAVQQITIQLAQVSGRVNDLLRTYNCKQGRVEIHCGLFDPVSRELVAPAFPRFVGFIDEAPVTTPKENDNGNVTLTCTSHTQEMNRSNPDTRSDASQKLRSPTDDFYKDTATVGTWPIFWGQAKS